MNRTTDIDKIINEKRKSTIEAILNNSNRRAALSTLAEIFVDKMMQIGLFQTCLNCEFWNKEKETCEKFNMRPPAKVIVVGCSEHSDIIPF